MKMKWFFLTFFVLLSSTTIIDAYANSEALFLTPYIETNKISEAKLKAQNSYGGYSGFLTVNKTYNSNLFFWFFEALTNSCDAPVALWLQGGPGYSCFYGIFMENGPFCFKGKDTTLLRRNNTWINFMNIIYIDNPVGSGFSFTENDNGYAKYQSDIVANLLKALDQFFKLFSEYRKNKFYLIGESYAAKYAITLAEAILNGATESSQMNLEGVVIESGVVDPTSIDIASFALQTSLVDSNVYEKLLALQATGLSLVEQGDFTNAFYLGTVPVITEFGTASGLSQQFNFLADEIPLSPQIVPFLEGSNVRKALHVGNATLSNLLGTNTVYFSLIDDLLRSVRDKLPNLFAKLQFLIYSGQLDIIANARSVDTYLEYLNFGNYTYVQRKTYLDGTGRLIGWTKQAGNVFRATIRGAGHIVPYDKPDVCYEMVRRFVWKLPIN